MSQPLRVGLIGAGRIARKHLRAFSQYPDRLKLEAVCDVNAEAAGRVADEFKVGRVYGDYREMLRDARIDAVDICTVHHEHAEHAIAAADSGRHILLEKPMAVSMPQCREMLGAAGRAGVVFMVAQNQRYKANYRGLRRAIAAGEIGQVLAARVESCLNVVDSATSDHWVFDGKKAGGGVVISLALHRIDLVRFVTGQDITRVLGATCMTTHPWFVNGAEDYAAATMQLSGGGMVTMFASFSSLRSPWGESLIVHGSQGTAHAMPPLVKYDGAVMIATRARAAECEAALKEARGFVPLELDARGLATGDMFVDELLHFEECCRTGARPVSDAADNMRSVAVVFAIYEAARTGGAVDVDLG